MDMADAMSLHMTALQRNMAKTLKGPGSNSHTQYVSSLLIVLLSAFCVADNIAG